MSRKGTALICVGCEAIHTTYVDECTRCGGTTFELEIVEVDNVQTVVQATQDNWIDVGAGKPITIKMGENTFTGVPVSAQIDQRMDAFDTFAMGGSQGYRPLSSTTVTLEMNSMTLKTKVSTEEREDKGGADGKTT